MRRPEQFQPSKESEDPYGRRFLERIAKATPKTREARLRKIETVLRSAVPQLTNLTLTKDELGIPHLEVLYEHWRPGAGKQREDQFSDGTLRLIALLWILLEGDSLLLLEEPELSLHSEVVRKLPPLIHRIQGRRKRQVVISTHSADLMNDSGIGGEEVFLLVPESEGTRVERASDRSDAKNLLEGGLDGSGSRPSFDTAFGNRTARIVRMKEPIPIHLVVEDELSEAVLREMLRQSGRSFAVGAAYQGGGFGYLRKNVKGFNHGAKGIPYFLLTDLDKNECAPMLIRGWLTVPLHPNLIFRVAVHEVEAWILADRGSIRMFPWNISAGHPFRSG